MTTANDQHGSGDGDRVLELLAEVLYVDDVDPDRTFTDLGLDSILAVEFLATLRTALGVVEPVEMLYQYGTPRRLLGHLGLAPTVE